MKKIHHLIILSLLTLLSCTDIKKQEAKRRLDKSMQELRANLHTNDSLQKRVAGTLSRTDSIIAKATIHYRFTDSFIKYYTLYTNYKEKKIQNEIQYYRTGEEKYRELGNWYDAKRVKAGKQCYRWNDSLKIKN